MLKEKNVHKYFMTFLQGYPLKTFFKIFKKKKILFCFFGFRFPLSKLLRNQKDLISNFWLLCSIISIGKNVKLSEVLIFPMFSIMFRWFFFIEKRYILPSLPPPPHIFFVFHKIHFFNKHFLLVTFFYLDKNFCVKHHHNIF